MIVVINTAFHESVVGVGDGGQLLGFAGDTGWPAELDELLTSALCRGGMQGGLRPSQVLRFGRRAPAGDDHRAVLRLPKARLKCQPESRLDPSRGLRLNDSSGGSVHPVLA